MMFNKDMYIFISISIAQAYIKKQVTPLFNHFKELTKNWTEIPANHTDQ